MVWNQIGVQEVKMPNLTSNFLLIIQRIIFVCLYDRPRAN